MDAPAAGSTAVLSSPHESPSTCHHFFYYRLSCHGIELTTKNLTALSARVHRCCNYTSTNECLLQRWACQNPQCATVITLHLAIRYRVPGSSARVCRLRNKQGAVLVTSLARELTGQTIRPQASTGSIPEERFATCSCGIDVGPIFGRPRLCIVRYSSCNRSLPGPRAINVCETPAEHLLRTHNRLAAKSEDASFV